MPVPTLLALISHERHPESAGKVPDVRNVIPPADPLGRSAPAHARLAEHAGNLRTVR